MSIIFKRRKDGEESKAIRLIILFLTLVFLGLIATLCFTVREMDSSTMEPLLHGSGSDPTCSGDILLIMTRPLPEHIKEHSLVLVQFTWSGKTVETVREIDKTEG